MRWSTYRMKPHSSHPREEERMDDMVRTFPSGFPNPFAKSWYKLDCAFENNRHDAWCRSKKRVRERNEVRPSLSLTRRRIPVVKMQFQALSPFLCPKHSLLHINCRPNDEPSSCCILYFSMTASRASSMAAFRRSLLQRMMSSLCCVNMSPVHVSFAA